MGSHALDRKSLVCIVTLLALVIPAIFTACAGGTINPADGSKQSSSVALDSVVPDNGPLTGGTAVLITGTNLAPVTQSNPPSVSFGGVAATQVTVISPLQVKAMIPPHEVGTVSVEVTTAAGESSSLSSGFTYTSNSPIISGISPNSGPAAGGTVVTVNGSNFSSGATVSFGGTSASGVSYISSSQLKATTPAHASGAVAVQVTNSDGASTTLANAFTYGSTTFSINSVSPISGPADGGTTVTISGSNFQSGASVSLGGFAATAVSVSNSTAIQATTPTHSAGSVTVTVTNPDGQSATLSPGFTFHSVDLVWSAPASSPVAISGYNVYRATSLAGPFGRLNGSTPIADTMFTDATVQGSATYYYEVKSVGLDGSESSPEGPVATTTSP